jgi:hypothetical protein
MTPERRARWWKTFVARYHEDQAAQRRPRHQSTAEIVVEGALMLAFWVYIGVPILGVLILWGLASLF